MRRPLTTELSVEDRSLARRWAFAVTSFYSIIAIVVVAAALATSRADNATVMARAEPQHFWQDRSGPALYGSLPNLIAARAAKQAAR